MNHLRPRSAASDGRLAGRSATLLRRRVVEDVLVHVCCFLRGVGWWTRGTEDHSLRPLQGVKSPLLRHDKLAHLEHLRVTGDFKVLVLLPPHVLEPGDGRPLPTEVPADVRSVVSGVPLRDSLESTRQPIEKEIQVVDPVVEPTELQLSLEGEKKPILGAVVSPKA